MEPLALVLIYDNKQRIATQIKHLQEGLGVS